MTFTFKRSLPVIILVLCVVASAAAGPLEDGAAAYSSGDYTTALQLLGVGSGYV
jgi:hypothetical protein